MRIRGQNHDYKADLWTVHAIYEPMKQIQGQVKGSWPHEVGQWIQERVIGLDPVWRIQGWITGSEPHSKDGISGRVMKVMTLSCGFNLSHDPVRRVPGRGHGVMNLWGGFRDNSRCWPYETDVACRLGHSSQVPMRRILGRVVGVHESRVQERVIGFPWESGSRTGHGGAMRVGFKDGSCGFHESRVQGRVMWVPWESGSRTGHVGSMRVGFKDGSWGFHESRVQGRVMWVPWESGSRTGHVGSMRVGFKDGSCGFHESRVQGRVMGVPWESGSRTGHRGRK